MFRLRALPGRTLIDCQPVSHMQTARRLAGEAARIKKCDVLVTRSGADDTERPTLVVKPDGTFAPPPGMLSECVRHEDKLCFCAACRAVRAAERAR